jgi:SAM-dependent methyltransferase
MLPRRVYDPLLPLAPLLDPLLDPPMVAATRRLRQIWQGPPLRARNAELRERALERSADANVESARALWPAVRRREPAAVRAYDALVARAVSELRNQVEAEVARGAFDRAAHLLDRLMYRDVAEWLDDRSFDTELRVRALDRLDRMNEAIGSYDAFVSVIVPRVERARAAGVACPVVVDLASGHGGFALELAKRLGAADGRARVIATDLLDEYLDIGRANARREGMPEHALSFMVQDALDLRGLEEKVGAPIDVVICTQTIHHFPPGFVSRMLAEAASVARHGAVIVDGERNLFALLLVAAVVTAIGRGGLTVLHDAVVSMRRMYTEQELALLALLSPPGADGARPTMSRGWVQPGHAWVELRA